MRYLLLLLELLFIFALLAIRSIPGNYDWIDQLPAGFTTTLRFLFFVALVDAIRRIIRFWYARRNPGASGKSNFDYGIDNIARVLIAFGAIVTIFKFFGVDIRTLLTSVSIVAAAIAIITKEYINDFIVGLYFSFSRNFDINDYVKIGEHKGKITELQILKVRLLNDDDDAVLLPNSKVYNSEIVNYTRRDIRLMNIDFELGLQQVSSLETLEEELIEALAEFSDYIEPDTFNLRIVEMKKDYVLLKFQYTLRQFDRDAQRQIRKRTVRQVFNRIAVKTPPTGNRAKE